MRAMRAETFSGYQGLKLVELPKPAVTDGKVLVRITAAGVTPLDHTILSGKFHGSKATTITTLPSPFSFGPRVNRNGARLSPSSALLRADQQGQAQPGNPSRRCWRPAGSSCASPSGT